MRFRVAIFSSFFFLAVGLAFPHILLKAKASSLGFKDLAEAKVGEFFKAKVHIGDIQVGFLNHVALSGLEIAPDREGTSPYEVHIREIVFRYDLFKLLTQNFETPSRVVLESPEISLTGELFPYALFNRLNFGQGNKVISDLRLADGYIRYPMPFMDSYLELQNVTGIFKPVGEGRFWLDIKAGLSGFLEGQATVQGEVDTLHQTHTLKLHLDRVDFGRRIPIPLRDLSGHLRWENDNLYFDGIQSWLHGWKVNFQGELLEMTGEPKFVLNWSLGKREPLAKGYLKMDLADGKLLGSFQSSGEPEIFVNGLVTRTGLRYQFDQLHIGSHYDGMGWFDVASGDYQIKLEKLNQNMTLVSNLRGADLNLNLVLNHIDFYGLDLVTSANIYLMFHEKSSGNNPWKFYGTFDTDYFILEYALLDDFRGSFEITPYGIKNFLSSWGRVFKLGGDISFNRDKPEGKFLVRVSGYDLKELKEFAQKRLPEGLSGLLEGRLKVEGPLQRPEVIGHFTVKDGALGKLQYDLGIIKFQGFPPSLELYDSQFMRGRTHFSLTGTIDYSLDNILYGVAIRTPEKFLIWKGWELNTSRTDGDVEISPSAGSTVLALKAGSSAEDPVLEQGKKNDDENYLVVGTRFKF